MGETDTPPVLAVGDGSVAVGLAVVGLAVVGVPDGVSVGLGVGVLVGFAAGVLGLLWLGAGEDGGAPRAGPTRLGPCTG